MSLRTMQYLLLQCFLTLILIASLAQSVYADTPSTGQVGLGFEITQMLGKGSLPPVKLDQQVSIESDPSILSFQTCFNFKKLKKGSTNLYLVYKTRFNHQIHRLRVRKNSACTTLYIADEGKYELYYFQTRYNKSNVISQKTLFTVSSKSS